MRAIFCASVSLGARARIGWLLSASVCLLEALVFFWVFWLSDIVQNPSFEKFKWIFISGYSIVIWGECVCVRLAHN